MTRFVIVLKYVVDRSEFFGAEVGRRGGGGEED